MTIAAGCLFFLESNQSSSLGKLHAGDIIKAELKVPVYCIFLKSLCSQLCCHCFWIKIANLHCSDILVFTLMLSLFLSWNCKSSLLFSDILVFIIMIGGCWPFCFQMICPMEERLAIIFYFNQQPLTIRVCSIFCCSCKTCLTPSCLWRGTRS